MNDKKKIPYFRYAFTNIYNYSVMLGLSAAGLISQNYWLVAGALGFEALWMVFAPDSKLLRKRLFEPMHEERLAKERDEERKTKLAHLPVADANRYTALERRSFALRELAAKNAAFGAELVRVELEKLDHLLESFLELIVASGKYEHYLASVDIAALEEEIGRFEEMASVPDDDARLRTAQKNLAVLEKRRERIAEIRRFVINARGQLDLIENTFELLGDQIVTMSSPRELGDQLDELMDGVEAARSTARETAAFLQTVST